MNYIDKDQEFDQMDIVRCKEHPKMVISFLYYKLKCPYKSRLVCVKCLKEQNIQNGFEDLLDVLKDPRVMLNKSDRPQGIYDLLNEYFNLLEQDPEEFISSFKEDILKQIQNLHSVLKEGIGKYNALLQEIIKVKEQYGEVIGHKQLRQEFKNILKVENYHQSTMWSKFEEKVANFVLQFENQKNQQLKIAFYKLKELSLQFLQPQLLNKLINNTSKCTKLFSEKVGRLGTFQQFTSIQDQHQFFGLIDKIYSKEKLPTNIKLIYRASQDGMNCQAFWNKCKNQGPTITLCNSKSGLIFGGYTPCKWIPNGEWQNDDSHTSFIFSYSKKEIYPIISGEKAIYCNLKNGPTFGGQQNLYIGGDFNNSGYSTLPGKRYSIQEQKTENYEYHLMKCGHPQLIEMQVFLIQ